MTISPTLTKPSVAHTVLVTHLCEYTLSIKRAGHQLWGQRRWTVTKDSPCKCLKSSYTICSPTNELQERVWKYWQKGIGIACFWPKVVLLCQSRLYFSNEQQTFKICPYRLRLRQDRKGHSDQHNMKFAPVHPPVNCVLNTEMPVSFVIH